MDRYDYEPSILTVSEPAWGDDETDQVEDIRGFKIFDRKVGSTEDVWIAFSRDVHFVQYLVALLNADHDLTRALHGPRAFLDRTIRATGLTTQEGPTSIADMIIRKDKDALL